MSLSRCEAGSERRQRGEGFRGIGVPGGRDTKSVGGARGNDAQMSVAIVGLLLMSIFTVVVVVSRCQVHGVRGRAKGLHNTPLDKYSHNYFE